MTYTVVIAVNQVTILMVMDRAILKTLENRSKEKVGQTVQSLDIISQDFIVVLVTGLKTLTNFDVAKWLQVTKLPVKYYRTNVRLTKRILWIASRSGFRAPPLPHCTTNFTTKGLRWKRRFCFIVSGTGIERTYAFRVNVVIFLIIIIVN